MRDFGLSGAVLGMLKLELRLCGEGNAGDAARLRKGLFEAKSVRAGEEGRGEGCLSVKQGALAKG